MANPRDKGSRFERSCRDALRTLTGLKWERTPGSGALDANHMMKGDLYVPNEKNLYAIECKHYREDCISSLLITGKLESQNLIKWWVQTERQAIQMDRKPLLLFKKDRGKILACFKTTPTSSYRYMTLDTVIYGDIYIAHLDEWYLAEKPIFILHF